MLTPLAVEDLDPCPLLPGLRLFVALRVCTSRTDRSAQKLVVIPVPGLFPRFVNVPSERGVQMAPLEEIILDNARSFFGGHPIGREAVFRITRDADVAIQEDEAGDLLHETRRDEMRGITCREEHGFDFGSDFVVHAGHLEFILKVRDGA